MWIVGQSIPSVLDVDCMSGPAKCFRCRLWVRAYQVLYMWIVGQVLPSVLDAYCMSGPAM